MKSQRTNQVYGEKVEETLTPMMRQYREAKASIPADAVLLFRLGDFYEEFFEDAEKVSSALELVLTKRQGVPMCGFPHHALDSYLPRLVAKGLKVAIAEQMEDPKLAKGIVKRQITRIITPGTVIDNTLLESSCNNFLCSIAFDKKENIIEIYEIPYTTTCEAIIDKVAELNKNGKIREINDMRDETDLGGLKLTIDLKRGIDPDKFMQKLFRLTPLQDNFPCNFNILIAGMPRVMGVGEILEEWTAWRTDFVKRRIFFQAFYHICNNLGSLLKVSINKSYKLAL